MGSSGNCEISEAREEQRPPIWKKTHNKALEDDINMLFESINLRTSKSLDFSDMPRNASKRPIRGNGSHSPGIGFSEPVSLKQALRGLCISQAAEIAAIKRMSLPASPRVSEAGKIGSLYRSVGESICLVVDGGEHHDMPVAKSANQSSCSSPAFVVKPITKGNCRDSGHHPQGGMATCSTNVLPQNLKESESAQSPPIDPAIVKGVELPIMLNEVVPAVEEGSNERDNCSKQDKKVSGPNMASSVPSKDCATSLMLVDKSEPKLSRKSRLQTLSSSSVVKVNKDLGPTRSTSRAVKSVRNKNFVIKKPRKVAAASGDGSSKPVHMVNSCQDDNLGQLFCQRCQCSLRGTRKEPPDGSNCDGNKPETISTVPTSRNIAAAVKSKKASKTCEKGDISQSSQSSICDFSSSTTSLSDESNLSGSGCSNRPHMSKDARWEAINHARKRYGFLGLSHFNLLKKLGSGDIGTVYLAELIGTSFLFAIKVMDNEFLARRKKMSRAYTEREILKMLDHPFLPTLHAQFTSDKLSCLVMEFCPGGDLHVLRQKQPGRCFPEQAARFYVAEVLLALEYLHMLGIVYRDLKPENILVREDGHIMLTDFDLSLRCSVCPTLVQSSSLTMEQPRVSGPCAGSNCIDPFCNGPSCKMSCFSPRILPATARARKMKSAAAAAAHAQLLPQLVAEPTEARSNSFVGTHEYLAPEIIKGEGHGSAVDWWTLGVFLYELLYGKTPFRGSENDETLANVILQNLKFPDAPIVSFQARDLIRSLLVKEPENRLGTETGAAEIKRHPFFEGLNWALIRCAVPPQVPEFYYSGNSPVATQEKGTREQLFELF